MAAKRSPKPASKPKMAASLEAAAAMMDCDPRRLRAEKKAGCPAFRSNGSVNIAELGKWLKEHGAPEESEDAAGMAPTKADLECRKLLRQCEKLERDMAISDGEYTANAQITEDLFRIGAATRAALQTLRADVPNWEGLPAAAMQRRMDERCDKICTDLHDKTSVLYAR